VLYGRSSLMLLEPLALDSSLFLLDFNNSAFLDALRSRARFSPLPTELFLLYGCMNASPTSGKYQLLLILTGELLCSPAAFSPLPFSSPLHDLKASSLFSSFILSDLALELSREEDYPLNPAKSPTLCSDDFLCCSPYVNVGGLA
jgi:hypothetical protein